MHDLAAQDRADLDAWSRILRHDPCSYCGAPAEHLDHIEPIALGGRQQWDNLTAACASCNRAKHTTPLLLFMAKKVG